MRVRAPYIAALAFLWPLLTIAKTCLDAFTHQPGIVGMGPLALAFSAGVVLLGVLMAAGPDVAGRVCTSPRRVLALGALASGLLAISELHLAPEALRLAAGIACALACAATLCALTLAWALAYRFLPAEEAGASRGGEMLVDACASLLLSFGIRLAFALLLGSTALAPAGEVLRVAYPLLACLAWATATRGAREGETPPGGERRPSQRSGARGLVIAVGMFVLLACVLVGIRASGTADYPIDVTGRRYWLGLAFGVLLFVLALVARRRPSLWLLPWGATLLLVFTGAMLATTAEGAAARGGMDAMIVGRLTMWALFWTLPAQLADVTRATGALYLVPQGVAYCLTDGLYLLLPSTGTPSAALNAASVTLVVALVGCALAVANRAGALTPAAPAATAEPAEAPSPAPNLAELRSHACQTLAARFGLTRREAVVLELVSLGRTVPQIAEEQCVSPNTVRTHTKGLYRKLDCHTKQDVIDVVARQMEEEAAPARARA